MANDRPEPKSPAVTPVSAEGAPVPGVRRPYVTPQLKHLGSVRDLTLGLSGSGLDFNAMMTM
jgi:hypothetical protein